MWRDQILKNGDLVRDTLSGWLCVIKDCSEVNRVFVHMLVPPKGEKSFRGCGLIVALKWLRPATEREKNQVMLEML